MKKHISKKKVTKRFTRKARRNIRSSRTRTSKNNRMRGSMPPEMPHEMPHEMHPLIKQQHSELNELINNQKIKINHTNLLNELIKSNNPTFSSFANIYNDLKLKKTNNPTLKKTNVLTRFITKNTNNPEFNEILLNHLRKRKAAIENNNHYELLTQSQNLNPTYVTNNYEYANNLSVNYSNANLHENYNNQHYSDLSIHYPSSEEHNGYSEPIYLPT